MTLVQAAVAKVERLMLDEFRQHPFHNLFFLGLFENGGALAGGTCSEKTLAFQATLQQQGIPARLHQAVIQGQECHRLLSMRLGQELFYCDIGNGWPSIRLFPASRDSAYTAYGIAFEGKIESTGLAIYQTTNGRRVSSIFIPHQARSEREILHAIEQRFSSGITYPFAQKLRFAQVIGEEFVFLRDCSLQRFHKTGRYQETVFTNQQEALQWVTSVVCTEVGSLAALPLNKISP